VRGYTELVSTHYQVLGVIKTASYDEIKKAWKQAARKTHPDLNKTDPQAEDRFKCASTAWDVLSDDRSRARYDAELLNPVRIPRRPPPPPPRRPPRPAPTPQAVRDPDLCLECEDVRLPHLLRCAHCETAWRRAATAPRGSMGMVVGYYSEQRSLESLYGGCGFGRDRAGTGRWIKPWAVSGKRRKR